MKCLTNLRNFLIEKNLTYLVKPSVLLGFNLVLDPRVFNFEQYDFGLTWEAANNCFVGLKHQSTSKEFLQLGKFFLLFHHNVSAVQTVGSEFVLDWQKRVLEARLGLLHRFNDDTQGKFKVNHHGYLDVVLKHRVTSSLTVGVASGFNLKAVVAEQRSKAIPFGLSFDLKF